MKLLKLVTKNFKKLGNFSADFTDGLNVIVGENAQGKSTLLQAIEAALFGVTVVPGKKENIPTWGQTNFSLELHFAVDSSIYVLTRSKSTAKLQRYGLEDDAEELVANGNTPVTAFIEQLLGLTAKDFNLFVQSKQGETSGVLTFGATALNQKVEEFAGVSLIDDVAKRANELAAEQRAIVSANEVDSTDLEEARSDWANASQKVTDCEKAVASAEVAAAAIQPLTTLPPSPSSQELTEQRRKADKQEQALAAAKADVALKNQAAVAAEEAVVAAGEEVDVEQLFAEKKEATELVRRRRADCNILTAEKLEADGAAKALERAQEARRAAEAAWELGGLERATSAVTEAQAEAGAAGEDVAVLSSRYNDMRSMVEGATCPTCGSNLSEHDPVKLENEFIELTNQLEKARQAKVAAADKLKLAEASLKKHAAAEQALDRAIEAEEKAQDALDAVRPALGDELEEATAALAAAEEALASISVKLQQADETNDAVRAARRKLARAETALEEAEDLVADLENAQLPRPTDVEIDAAAQAEAAYRAVEQEHDRLTREANSTLTLARAEVRSARDVLSYAEADLKRLQECAERVATASLLADKAGRLSRFLRDRRQNYLQQIWQAVMGTASRQVATASRGLITRIANNDGEFTFEEDGVMAPVASASGAQKAFIGSAVRIGLTRTLYGRDSLLIFDEPTESMSERNASGLAASLAGAASQLLLITHREQDQGLAANIVQVGA